jgi:hypothetical protein
VACILPQMDTLMSTKTPRGQARTLEQQLATQALHHRQLRIEHGTSSVQRCRVVQDRSRLWKNSVCALVMARCCALHTFRGFAQDTCNLVPQSQFV